MRSSLAFPASIVAMLIFCCGGGAISSTDDGGGADGGGGGGPVEGEPTALAGITAAHNQVRSAHGVVDIVWDNDLASVAQQWVNNCEWGHSEGRRANYPGYVGENIYGSSGVPTGA
ncbi:MAG: CAP domain-containing protein [Myxococcales bacterium]|nr:CAP domain-containing protein [Myxococcales bacterium]